MSVIKDGLSFLEQYIALLRDRVVNHKGIKNVRSSHISEGIVDVFYLNIDDI